MHTLSDFVNYYGKKNSTCIKYLVVRNAALDPGLKAHTDAVDNEYTMSTHVTQSPYTPAWVWPLYFVKKPKQPVTEMCVFVIAFAVARVGSEGVCRGTWETQPAATDPSVVAALLNPGMSTA
jgi:hypothetical protein